MIKEYKASLQLNNELTVVYFTTESNPVDYLWTHYGISTYIEYVEEVKQEEQIETTELIGEASKANGELEVEEIME